MPPYRAHHAVANPHGASWPPRDARAALYAREHKPRPGSAPAEHRRAGSLELFARGLAVRPAVRWASETVPSLGFSFFCRAETPVALPLTREPKRLPRGPKIGRPPNVVSRPPDTQPNLGLRQSHRDALGLNRAHTHRTDTKNCSVRMLGFAILISDDRD